MTPPTLITLVRRLQRERPLWNEGEHLLCACSGGPDSTALLHVLVLLRERLGHRLSAVGIDHGLRAEASEELQRAAELADAQGVAFAVRRVELDDGPNLQDRARRARHTELQAEATRVGARAIALGHTADDRAETVLLRLLRGSGARGLGAMPPSSPGVRGSTRLVRPLLLARRADVMAHLERHRIATADDPSNQDARFTRVRVRQELLPLLEGLSPSIVAHLCRLADELAGEGDDPWAGLSRAQRDAIAHAIRRGRSGAKVRLEGGRDVELRFSRPSETADGD